VVIGVTAFLQVPGRLANLPEFFQWFRRWRGVYEGDTAIVELALALTVQGTSGGANYLYLENGRVQSTAIHTEDIDALPTRTTPASL